MIFKSWRIRKQAREWFVSNLSIGVDDKHDAAFLAWLQASPLHVLSYLRVARVMEKLRTLTVDADVPLEEFLARSRARAPSLQPSLKSKRRFEWSATRERPMGILLAVAVSALSLGLLWWGQVNQRAHEITLRARHGEVLVSRLPDGSTIHLDSDSAVLLRYTARERVAVVSAGRSFFEVVHDEKRRFRLESGDAGAIAVGTQFEVTRDKESTLITVADGKVAVFAGTPSWLSYGAQAPPDVRRVSAGYALRVVGKTIAASPVRVDLTQSLGWLVHKIVFENRPLSAVVEEFNRYSPIRIEVEGPNRDLPLSGSFEANDAQSFITFLRTLPGIRIDNTKTQIRIIADAK
jgi:transmembrane sensor